MKELQACFYPQNDCHCLCRVHDVTDLSTFCWQSSIFIVIIFLLLVVFDAVRWQMTFFVCTLICCTSLGPHFSFVRVFPLFLFRVFELALLILSFLILFFWMKTNTGHKSRPGVHGNHLMCNGIVPVPISLPLFSLFVYLLMSDLSLAVIPVFTHTFRNPLRFLEGGLNYPIAHGHGWRLFCFDFVQGKNWAEKCVY